MYDWRSVGVAHWARAVALALGVCLTGGIHPAAYDRHNVVIMQNGSDLRDCCVLSRLDYKQQW